MRRVPENQRLKHRVMLNMTDEQHEMLVAEAHERGLAPSIIARIAFSKGLPTIRKKRQAVRRQINHAKRKENGHES